MVGFIIGGGLLGAALVAGALALRQGLRRRRFYGRPHGRGSSSRRAGARHALLARLDTTPAQERVFAQARTELQGVLAQLRAELPLTREQAALSVAAAHFDEAGLRERFARHAALLEELQRTALGALSRVHAALEPGQREELAGVLGGPCHRRLAR